MRVLYDPINSPLIVIEIARKYSQQLQHKSHKRWYKNFWILNAATGKTKLIIIIQWESLQGWTKKKQDQLIRIGLEVKLHYYHKAMCPLGFMGELAARWFMKLHYIDPAS